MAKKAKQKDKQGKQGKQSKENDSPKAVQHSSDVLVPKAPKTLLQSFAPSEVPISFVWLLGLYLSFGALFAPWGQTAAGFNPDAHTSIYFQLGTLFFLLVYFAMMMGKGNRCVIAIPRAPVLFPILLFVGWMAISLIWANSFWEGIIKTLDWAAAALAFVLILLTVRNVKAFKALIVALFWGGFAIALLGVAQFLFSVDWVHQHAAPAATFGNKNMAAQYAVATIPFGVCLFMAEKDKFLSAVYAIGSVFIFSLLQYAHARGSWLAGIIQILLFTGFLIWIKRKHATIFHFANAKKLIALGAGVLIVIMSSLTPTSFVDDATMGINKDINPKGQSVGKSSFADTIKHALDVSGTKTQRFLMWGNSFHMLKDTLPLGAGIGAWTLLYAKYQAAYQPDYMLVSGYYHLNAHNDYIEFAAELGIVGIVAMLWAMVLIMLMVWHILTSPRLNPEVRTLALAPVISTMGIFVTAFFSFPMQQATSIMLLLIGVAGMAVLTWGLTDKAQERGPYQIALPKFPVRAGTFIVLLAVLLFTANNHYNWHRAEIAFRNAMASKYMNKPSQVNHYTRETIKLNPLRKRPYYQLGNHYLRKKDYRTALKYYEKVLEEYPYRIEMMQSVANSYLSVGRTAEALQLLELWEDIQPHSRKAKILLGMLYYQMGRLGEAKSLVDESFRAHGTPEEEAFAKNLLQQIAQKETELIQQQNAAPAKPAEPKS